MGQTDSDPPDPDSLARKIARWDGGLAVVKWLLGVILLTVIVSGATFATTLIRVEERLGTVERRLNEALTGMDENRRDIADATGEFRTFKATTELRARDGERDGEDVRKRLDRLERRR